MLLPPDPLASPEEQSADPREELVQRLIEHEKYKNAAQLLYQKQQIEEHVWSRPDKSLYHDEGTEGELVVSLVDLVRVFQQVLERKKEVVRIELTHDVFTVAQMIAQLRSQILSSDHLHPSSLIQFFEACLLSPRHDRRFPGRSGNGQTPSRSPNPGKSIRRHPRKKSQIVRRSLRRKRRHHSTSTREYQ